ncbi:DUF6232 family protein [Planococcus shenhongbingii]|uniref:DUF6232 family protein n=1 Tax=Planococcus shenhongbingii TaxID=3058398 RepID=UPI002614CE75|nr:DUF6232 family protein [Planococcus sp. N016]WKA57798.1 DUF6232 family protein [Planococcus sp. N016]
MVTQAQAQEKIFFQSENVLISNTRMNLGGTTYATANVTSVSTLEAKPGRKLEIILGLIGLVALTETFLGGIILIALAVLIFKFKKTKYIVKLSSSANEKDALWSTDKNFVHSVVEAINEAMIFRG